MRFTRARWKYNKVEGFSITAILLRRLGDTKSVQTPSASRSHEVRHGARRRARLRMSSWCLTASDSATTAPRPPGLASRARVTSKWAIKLNSKLINANFNHGIGALAYFRRVIENKVNLLLDLVADAAKLAGVDEAGLQELERVKATHQVDRKIEIASKLLPAHLKPPGSPDPLDRLYKSYSSGLHGESDEKCLDIFKEGRFVFEYLFRTLTVGNEEAGEYIKRLSAEPSREKKSLQAKRRALRGKTRAHYTRPSAPVGSRRASGEALTSNVSTLTPRLMAASL